MLIRKAKMIAAGILLSQRCNLRGLLFCALMKEFDNFISCCDKPYISSIVFYFHNPKQLFICNFGDFFTKTRIIY